MRVQLREKIRPAPGAWTENAKFFAQRAENGPQQRVFAALGEFFRGGVPERLPLGEFFRGGVPEWVLLGDFFRAITG